MDTKNIDHYIRELKPHVLELFKNDSSGHDISHLERVLKTALYISRKENGDEIIIGIAAFLHDIHRIMQVEQGRYVSPKDSLETIRKILTKVDLTKEQKDKICYCIEYHEEYNWNGNNVEDINTLILQDADNIDAIGAIGIGRVFTYCGANNIPMYNDTIPLEERENHIESDKDDSAIHHFYHKLFKLGDNMNTNAAKEIASRRIELMQNFVNEFLTEWEKGVYKEEQVTKESKYVRTRNSKVKDR